MNKITQFAILALSLTVIAFIGMTYYEKNNEKISEFKRRYKEATGKAEDAQPEAGTTFEASDIPNYTF